MALQLQVYNQNSIQQLPEKVRSLLYSLDIYYQPEFLKCDAAMQGGEYEIAVCIDNENYWIYPYIVLPIAGTPYFDLSSPYGYAGPVSSSENFGQTAELQFNSWVRERGNIVTEFVRYHYLYNSEFQFTENCTNHLNRTVVLLPTDLSEEEIWTKQFSGTNRNLVRKLEKEGYTWSVETFKPEAVSTFDAAYRANMEHTQASDFYFFSNEFYQNLIASLGDKLKLAKVEKDGIIYSSALFFVSGGIVTYYLSARNLEYPKVPGSNLLLSKMAFWAQENSQKIVNFGGGLSLAKDDFLFKFKSNFGQQFAAFNIGKRIHQVELYNEIIEDYKQNNGAEAYESVKHILQFYR